PKVTAMPGHEPPTAVDFNVAWVIAAGAVVAVNVPLLHPAAWVVWIRGREIAQRLVGLLQTGDFSAAEIPHAFAREYRTGGTEYFVFWQTVSRRSAVHRQFVSGSLCQ